MNTRNTWLLVLIAVLLGGYVYFSEKTRTPRGALVEYSSFDPSRVRSVELLRSNVVIRVERSTNGWNMVLPVPYPAQATAVDAFVDGLARLQPRLTLGTAAATDSAGTNELRDFGLGDGATVVTLNTSEGAPLIRHGSARWNCCGPTW